MAWTPPEQCCGMIEKIIGFSLKRFYGDAIELVHSVKVRVILGPVQMRTRQFSEPDVGANLLFLPNWRECVWVCIWVKV